MGLFVVVIAAVVALTNLRGTWRVSKVIKQLDVQAAEPPAEQVALVNDVARKAGLSVGLVMSDYPLCFYVGISQLEVDSFFRSVTNADCG